MLTMACFPFKVNGSQFSSFEGHDLDTILSSELGYTVASYMGPSTVGQSRINAFYLRYQVLYTS